jgi:hypothetical protein
MEFNTQICTNKEQSKRLIDLGLNPNTSDMHHYRWSEGYWDIQNCPPRGSNSNFIPAWSLHRLINMMPYELDNYNYTIHLTQTGVEYSGMFDSAHGIEELVSKNSSDNLYDNIIDCIEWLIKENYFNKEYLKKED